MASTHLSLHFHIIFSTKNRVPFLKGEMPQRLHEYLGGTVRNLGGYSHAVGGTADHVHLFLGMRATQCVSDMVREIKVESSKWLVREHRMHAFSWQEGYGAFTVSASHMEAVKRYVLNQEKHHRVRTFQDEYVEMLKRGLVAYDEAYLW